MKAIPAGDGEVPHRRDSSLGFSFYIIRQSDGQSFRYFLILLVGLQAKMMELESLMVSNEIGGEKIDDPIEGSKRLMDNVALQESMGCRRINSSN